MKGIERRRRLTSTQWSPSVWELTIVCAVGIVLIFASQQMRLPGGVHSRQMRIAAETMQLAMDALATYRSEMGPEIDPSTDINNTGLIGSYFTQITTTVGSLEAKRTSTNPNMASLLVSLLQDVGVQPDDFIAVGASGSFPALILASASAAQTLDLRLGLILSLGSSQFGANMPEFTWLEMEQILADAGIVSCEVVAASLGGDLDIARDLSADARALLQAKGDAFGITLINEPDLAANVEQRMSAYHAAAGEEGIAAFVNIGGAWANMGIDASILLASPGLIRLGDLPDEDSRGVIHAMDAEGVPVIHLLNMKELTQRNGIPWDPSPLPEPGANLAASAGETSSQDWIIASYLTVALLWLGSVVVRRWIRKRRRVAIDGQIGRRLAVFPHVARHR